LLERIDHAPEPDRGGRPYRSFGFLFSDGPADPPAQIVSVGWELQTSTAYDWDGRSRKDRDRCLFQYTLSGRGAIELPEGRFDLGPGRAFLVSIPGDHRYYLPSDSERWELMYVMLAGVGLRRTWDELAVRLGPAPAFHPESGVIRALRDLYRKAADRSINDAYQASALAYAFLMELHRAAARPDPADRETPHGIRQALEFLHARYNEPIGLDDLAAAAGMSRYHFARLFRRSVGTTPLKYLTKLRIERASALLRTTGWTLDRIAREVGYANGHYFGKAFKHVTGMTPGEFRDARGAAPVDQLYVD